MSEQPDYVVSDNRKGACEMTKHLIGKGHKRIVYMGMPPNYFVGAERLQGYKDALIECGLPVSEELIFFFERDADAELPVIISKVLSYSERPTALFTGGDLLAVRTIKLLKERGIRVPEDMAVTGYDNHDFFEFCQPSITTVDQNGYEIGEKATQLLLEKIKGEHKGTPQHIVVDSKLIIRSSSGGE